MSKIKNSSINREDLRLIALYSMLYSKYKEARQYESEIIKYIFQNYTSKDWTPEEIVTDALYGKEADLNEFLVMIKEHMKRTSK